jgi:uncharacterized delta-60 repeat protein
MLFGMACAVASAACIESRSYQPAEGLELLISSETFRLDEGGSRRIPIAISRGAARDEAVELQLEDLPMGVTADPSVIEAGEEMGAITLHASGALLSKESTIKITAIARALSVESSAKIYVAGRSGTIDASYGAQGSLSIPISGSRMVALESGGVLLIGSVAGMLTIVKLTADGALDESFGGGGYLTPALPAGLQSERSSVPFVVELPDKRLLLVAALDDSTTSARPDFLSVSRLMADGSLDQSYGSSGHVLDPVPNRPYAAALGIDGELLLWNGAANDSRLTRVLSSGAIGASSTTFDTSTIVHISSTMVVQPDGKVVIPAYEPGLKPVLLRFNSSLQLDPDFGRSGRLATNIVGLGLRRLPDGTYVMASGVGDPAAPAVMRFDTAWRSLPGFETGYRSFASYAGTFAGSVSLEGATFGVSKINNAARIGRVLDNGMIDHSYGVDGLVSITSLANADGALGIEQTSRFGLLVVVRRDASLSTEIFRVWQ